MPIPVRATLVMTERVLRVIDTTATPTPEFIVAFAESRDETVATLHTLGQGQSSATLQSLLCVLLLVGRRHFGGVPDELIPSLLVRPLFVDADRNPRRSHRSTSSGDLCPIQETGARERGLKS